MNSQLLLDIHGKQGFRLTFPYSEAMVKAIKQCSGLAWDKSSRAWLAAGPEVVLDLERYHFIYQSTPAALEREAQFRQQLHRILETKYQNLNGATYGFQRVGSEVLALQDRGILGDDMGLGKSREALDAAQAIGAKNILVLAPKTIVYNWELEIAKWGYSWPVAILPDNKRKQFWQEWSGGGVVLANYEKTILQDWPVNRHWQVVILDEATRVKNTQTKTWRRVQRIVQNSDYIWALTGTPLEMRLEELWGIMSLLRPTVLGSFSRFRDQHLIQDFWGNVVGSKNHELLRERIAPWLLRRTKAEVASYLPPKLYNEIWIDLSLEEREEYEKIKRAFLLWLKEHGRSASEANVLTQLLRLQQFTSSPTLLEAPEEPSEGREQGLPGGAMGGSPNPSKNGGSRGSKLEALKDLLAEWEGRAVVFTRFAKMAELLVKELQLPEDAIIAGYVPAEERVPRITDFNEGRLGKVLASTDAGSFGLNITGADMVVMFDLLFNPARMVQREDRLHRIGQERPVNVVKLLCKGTIDVGMNKILAKREMLFDDVINRAATEERARWSEAQLRRLVDGNE